MSNEIEKSMNFEDKMKERIREGIGDLITDEELSKIIDAGIREVFFTKELIHSSGYGPVKYKPSLIETVIREELDLHGRAKEVCKEWMTEHSDEITDIVDGLLRDGVGNLMMNTISEMFQSSLTAMKYDIQTNIANGMNNGY